MHSHYSENTAAHNRNVETRSKPLADAGVFLFLFALFAALISWPLITIAEGGESIFSIYIYLFFVWFALIVVLFVIGKFLREPLDAVEPD